MTIITAAGLTNLSDSFLPFNKNGSVVTLKKISETDWLLFGDIAEGDSVGFVGVGDPLGGGFYAGDIQYPDGQWYKLIIADVSADITGENSRWKTSNTNTPNTDHETDGVANTNAMIAAGINLHPAANHCVNYDGGGYTDWYMPAKDELNVIYWNLGYNLPNCPPDFQSGGPQAFASSYYYWTSTQSSSGDAWSQGFSDGFQSATSRTSIYRRVRPVRRIPFTP